MAKNFSGDIDIDFRDRSEILNLLPQVVPASIIGVDSIELHQTGVYAQQIPVDPVTGLSSIDYKRAEDFGYFKFDLLNNHAYKDVQSRAHLKKLIDQEPIWELLDHREIVDQLFHIKGHFDIVDKMKPKSIVQLAMVLAMIRPGKRYLVGKSWSYIEQHIWTTSDEGYSFKASHAIAYSLLIVMQLNLLAE